MSAFVFFRIVKSLLLFSLLIIGIPGAGFAHKADEPPIKLPLKKGQDGNFTLTSHLGSQVSLKDYRGKVVLLNFGYTSCPDVCPIILGELGQVLKKLGKEAKQVQTLFVSVDPERDTIEVIKAYLANFHPTILGLTGPPEVLAELRYYYGSNALKEITESGVVYAHTDYVYLIDQQGQLRTRYQSKLPLEHIVKDVQQLLKVDKS